MKGRISVTLIIMCLFICGINSGCKKLASDPQPDDYDIANKIFRVHATTDAGTPYNITINQQSSGAAANVIEVKQTNGGDFNYGFTPQAGSTVTVKVQADKAINCYVFYNGANFGSIAMTAQAGGKFEGELVKTIAN